MHFTEFPQDCGGFSLVKNMRSNNGGIKQSGIDTVLGCKKRCYNILNGTCLGFDFNDKNECYLHDHEMNFWRLHIDAHFDHYSLAPPCEGNLPTWSNLTSWFRHGWVGVYI